MTSAAGAPGVRRILVLFPDEWDRAVASELCSVERMVDQMEALYLKLATGHLNRQHG